MGFFSQPATTTEPPNRSKRETCWAARDKYFTCLDKIEVVNPFDKGQQGKINKNCSSEDQQFQQDCVASWVKYFKEKRPFDIKKEKMLQQAAAENAEVVQLNGVRK